LCDGREHRVLPREQKVNRARHSDPAAVTMRFGEFVVEHYLPLQAELSPVTRKNIASHVGDGTGRARGQGGAKAACAARHALLTVLGRRPIKDIGRVDLSGSVKDRAAREGQTWACDPPQELARATARRRTC
jgi:hypothetical protein